MNRSNSGSEVSSSSVIEDHIVRINDDSSVDERDSQFPSNISINDQSSFDGEFQIENNSNEYDSNVSNGNELISNRFMKSNRSRYSFAFGANLNHNGIQVTNPNGSSTSVVVSASAPGGVGSYSGAYNYFTGDSYVPFCIEASKDLDFPATRPMEDYIFCRAFKEGAWSDISIKAFGRRYSLHRIILDRCPFFRSLLSGEWSKNRNEIELDFTCDGNITQHGFDLALKILYGHYDSIEEDNYLYTLLATAAFLALPDIVSHCAKKLLLSLNSKNLGEIIHFAESSDYGVASKSLLKAGKHLLYTAGTSLDLHCWESVPIEIAADVMGSDGFYAKSEWDRCIYICNVIKMFQKKIQEDIKEDSLETFSDDSNDTLLQKESSSQKSIINSISDLEESYTILGPLFQTLQNDVYYMHMTFEQLQKIGTLRDYHNKRFISQETISGALWNQITLRQKVANAHGPVLKVLSQTTENSETFKYSVPNNILVRENIMPGSAARKNSMNDKLKSNKSTTFNTENRSSSTSEHGISNESANTDKKLRSMFPPFRFSIDVADILAVKARRECMSQIVWYGGSYWRLKVNRVPCNERNTRYKLAITLYRTKYTEFYSSRNSKYVNLQSSKFGGPDNDVLEESIAAQTSLTGATEDALDLPIFAEDENNSQPSNTNNTNTTGNERGGRPIDDFPQRSRGNHDSRHSSASSNHVTNRNNSGNEANRLELNSNGSAFNIDISNISLNDNNQQSNTGSGSQEIISFVEDFDPTRDLSLETEFSLPLNNYSYRPPTVDYSANNDSTFRANFSPKYNTDLYNFPNNPSFYGVPALNTYLDTRSAIMTYSQIFSPSKLLFYDEKEKFYRVESNYYDSDYGLTSFCSSPELLKENDSFQWVSSSHYSSIERAVSDENNKKQFSQRFMISIGLV